MRILSFAIVLALFWFLHSGYTKTLLLALGAFTIVATVYVANRMGTIDEEGHPIHLLKGAVTFAPWLIWEILKSSISVAKLIISPSLPISPRMVEVEASQKTRVGVNVYGNAITLTPGTMTVAVEDNTLLIHALTKEGADDLAEGTMDRRVSRFEAGGL